VHAQVAIIYVDTENDGSTVEDGSRETPYGTIQEGINNASNGDTIRIADGIYNEAISLTGTEPTGLTIEGFRDGDNNKLTIIEPPITSITWTQAFDFGPGCWSTTDIASDPTVLSYDGILIPKMGSHLMGEGEWGWLLLKGSDREYFVDTVGATAVPNNDIDVWSCIRSCWGQIGSTTYLKLTHNTDPNNMSIRVGTSESIGINVNGVANHLIRDIAIRGFHYNIRVRNATATGNVIDNIDSRAASMGVHLYSDTASNTIKGSYFTYGMDMQPGVTQGAYSNDDTRHSDKTDQAFFFYRWPKGVETESSTRGYGIWMQDQGSGNVIEYNTFEDITDATFVGVTDGTTRTGLRIRFNLFKNISSTGTMFNNGYSDGRIYGNTFINCAMCCRYHDQDTDYATDTYFYNNFCWMPPYVGTQIYTHWNVGQPALVNTIKHNIYNNIFQGGYRGFTYSASVGDPYNGDENFYLQNNIFCVQRAIQRGVAYWPTDLALFDYNYVGGEDLPEGDTATWWGANNIEANDTYIWGLPTDWNDFDFRLPSSHACWNAAGTLPVGFVDPGGLGDHIGARQPVYVDASYSGTAETGTIDQPYNTIQEGIDASISGLGDTVQVLAGTYNELLTLNKNNVRLRGQWTDADEPLVILEPPLVSLTWTLDETYGPNVWKTSDIPHSGTVQPEILSYDGKVIARIRNSGTTTLGGTTDGWMGTNPGVDDWGWDALNSTNPWLISSFADRTIDNIPSNPGTVDFWSGIYSIWGSLPNGTESYFRHKDGLNPNDLPIRAGAPQSFGIMIYGTYSYNTIEGFWIRGFDECIRVRNSGGSPPLGTLLQKNKMTAFSYGVRIYEGTTLGPEDTVVQYNDISTNPDGRVCGAWGATSTTFATVDTAHKELMYEYWKYVYHISDSDSTPISLFNECQRTILRYNYIHKSMTGIGNVGSLVIGSIIYRNRLQGSSSVGMTLLPGLVNTMIYENELFDIQACFRLHQQHQNYETDCWIFNNKIWQPNNIGNCIFTHWYDSEPQPTAARNFYIYNNSFSGGFTGIYWNSVTADQYGDQPGFLFQNNIFNSVKTIYGTIDPPSQLGDFSYNWCGGSRNTTNEAQSWWTNNIVDDATEVWPLDVEQPFANWELPSGHAARNAAGTLPFYYPYHDKLGPDMGAFIEASKQYVSLSPKYSLGSI
jgi:hypothetical protein